MVVVPNLLFYIFLFCTVFVGVSLLGDFVISIVEVVQDLREKKKRDKPVCKQMVVFLLDAKEKEILEGVLKCLREERENEEREKDKLPCLAELVNAPMGEGKEMFVFSLDAKEKGMLLDILMFSMNEMMDLNTKDRFQNIYDEEQRKALHENMDFVAVLLKRLYYMEEGEEVLNDAQE